MSKDVIFNENKLILSSKPISFKYKIAQIIETDVRVFVLLEIPDDVDDCENIYAFTKSGDLVWIVQSVKSKYPNIKHFSPYVGMSLRPNGNILATNYFGLAYEVSNRNGFLLSSTMVK